MLKVLFFILIFSSPILFAMGEPHLAMGEPHLAMGEPHHLMLTRANDLASSDPLKSKLLLQRISKDQLSKPDSELFSYLSSYFIATSGKLDEAIVSLLPLTKSGVSPNVRVRAYSLLLLMYAGQHEWDKGLETLSKLSTLVDGHSDEKLSMTAYTGMINFYNLIGEHQLAKKMAKKALAAFSSPHYECNIRAQQLYADTMLSSKYLTKAMFSDVINLCKSINLNFVEQGAYIYMAEFFLKKQMYTDAEKILLDNLISVEKTGYHTMSASYYSQLAEIYVFQGDYLKAESFAQKIVKTKPEHQNAKSIATAYKVLSKVFEEKKDYDKALDYFKKHNEVHQLKLDQNNAKLLAIQKAKFDAIEKNVQIALLDKENTLLKIQALLDSEAAQSKRLALALLTMALVVFILWTYKNRKNYLEMRYFAQTDELTGIANRHHFAQLALSAITLCKKTDQPVSFVIFDLDFFKKINDTYGHIVGDEALKMAVSAAKSACRKNDIIGRLGGEEFGILLAGCGNHLAAHIAEKCRKAIEEVNTSASGHQFTLTASFGVSDSSICGYEFTQLFAGADRALYQSKDLGRNQVFNYQTNTFAFDT